MKTLEQHNRENNPFNKRDEPEKAGVMCDKCGKEMIYTNPGITLASIPPKKNVHCECGHHGYKII